jgi:hypothetical protein
MPTRETLPARRRSESFPVTIPGLNRQIVLTVGYYKDGRVGEVFVADVKAGSTADAASRDAAVILSIAMQYGVPLDVIQKAITREEDGSASSVLGVLIDKLVAEKGLATLPTAG